MATHSSILAWEIPGTEEPGGLQSMESQKRVGHDLVNKQYKNRGFPGGSDTKDFTCNAGDLGLIPGLGRSPGGEQGNPLQYSCLNNYRGQRILMGYSLWGPKESGTTEQLSTAHTDGSVVKKPPANAGTWVWSLVQEDSTCCGTMKSMHHNYWACDLKPGSQNYWSPQALESVLCNKRNQGNEKPAQRN